MRVADAAAGVEVAVAVVVGNERWEAIDCLRVEVEAEMWHEREAEDEDEEQMKDVLPVGARRTESSRR